MEHQGECFADIEPAGGDGMVDVQDLVQVIAQWGSPGGIGDIAPPGGDGLVNVVDLLAVIAACGMCER